MCTQERTQSKLIYYFDNVNFERIWLQGKLVSFFYIYCHLLSSELISFFSSKKQEHLSKFGRISSSSEATISFNTKLINIEFDDERVSQKLILKLNNVILNVSFELYIHICNSDLNPFFFAVGHKIQNIQVWRWQSIMFLLLGRKKR